MSSTPKVARWFVRGDIDGFFGLALDNLIQVLVLLGLCRFVLRFDTELIFGRMLPGIAISLIAGNFYYAWQAMRLARRTGRDDVCALPYGINTVSLFAHVFLVMLPARLTALASGVGEQQASELAFRAGIVATLGCGVFEAVASLGADWLRRWAPRAAMLSTLGGIAMTFIAASFLFRAFAAPLVAFLPIGIVLLTYFGRVAFPFGVPGGFVAVAIGTTLAWITPGFAWNGGASFATVASTVGLHLPKPILGAIVRGLAEGHGSAYFAVIVPMGLFSVVGSLQNLESAAAAGDDYRTVESLAANGLGTVLGACFGSPFPTTIYIGHPGWKALGARVGYSVVNGVFFTILGLSGAAAVVGYLVPIESGLAIVLWIGIVMVSQAFAATKVEHAPAVAVGLLPAVAAWGAMMLKTGLRVGGLGTATNPFSPSLLDAMRANDVFAHGAFALEQGFLFTCMVWSALTVEVIERRFLRAAAWAGSGALLSALGLMHSYHFSEADTVASLGHPGWSWSLAYALLAVLIAAGRVLPESKQSAHG